jgi:hypothetical protein
MNEMSIKYGRDKDICYWYYLFKEFEDMDIKPQYFREHFELPERKFWNQIRLYRPPHLSPAIQKKYKLYYDEFVDGDLTIREFTTQKKIRMSTFDLWRRHFMFQERVEQLRNDGKLIKPLSLIYSGGKK